MKYFTTQTELREYLDGLHKGYGTLYADTLWRHQVNASSILANASVESLMRAGVTEELHASDINAQAATSGEVEAVLLASHLARPSRSMHLISAESNIQDRCSNHWPGPLMTNSRSSSWLWGFVVEQRHPVHHTAQICRLPLLRQAGCFCG